MIEPVALGGLLPAHRRERRARGDVDDAVAARHRVGGVLALAGRAHPGREVVVDAEVVERCRDRREVAVLDEGVVGEVRGVVEEAVGVGAVEERAEEEAVERVVGAAHGIRVALVAVVGAPDVGRVEGDRHLGAGGSARG